MSVQREELIVVRISRIIFEAVFPYKHPALLSVSVAFLGIFIASKLDRSEAAQAENKAFDAQFVRGATRVGAKAPAAH